MEPKKPNAIRPSFRLRFCITANRTAIFGRIIRCFIVNTITFTIHFVLILMFTYTFFNHFCTQPFLAPRTICFALFTMNGAIVIIGSESVEQILEAFLTQLPELGPLFVAIRTKVYRLFHHNTPNNTSINHHSISDGIMALRIPMNRFMVPSLLFDPTLHYNKLFVKNKKTVDTKKHLCHSATMKLNVSKIKDRLWEMRKTTGWLVQEAGISRQMLSYYFRTGSVAGVIDIAKALDLDPKDLIVFE